MQTSLGEHTLDSVQETDPPKQNRSRFRDRASYRHAQDLREQSGTGEPDSHQNPNPYDDETYDTDHSVEEYNRIAEWIWKPSDREQVLDTFEGTVDAFEGDQAFVSLVSKDGIEMTGTLSASELRSKGIQEYQRFICKTIKKSDGSVLVEIDPVPAINLTDVEMQAIIQDSYDAIDESVFDFEK